MSEFENDVKDFLAQFENEPSRNKIMAFIKTKKCNDEQKKYVESQIQAHFAADADKTAADADKTADKTADEAYSPHDIPQSHKFVDATNASQKARDEEWGGESSGDTTDEESAPKIAPLESAPQYFVPLISSSDDALVGGGNAQPQPSFNVDDDIKFKESQIEREMAVEKNSAVNPSEIAAQAAAQLLPAAQSAKDFKRNTSKFFDMTTDETIDVFSAIVEKVGENASENDVLKEAKKLNAFNMQGLIKISVMKYYRAYVSGGEEAIKEIKSDRDATTAKLSLKVKRQRDDDSQKVEKKANPASAVPGFVLLAAPPAGYFYSLVKSE